MPTLIFAPGHSLEELNRRFWKWVETDYNQRPHTALAGESPAQRFARLGTSLRLLEANVDLDRLFFMRLERRVHSSLMGSDLLRHLVKLGGKQPQYRRGDNVVLLTELWREWAPAWPLLLIEEAQSLAVASLEELRLLSCARADATPPFSLLLCGDEELLGRLELNVNKPLVSRLGFCFHLSPWPAESFQDYLQQRLAEVGIHSRPFEPAAETLLLQAAQGIPRTLNALLQRAMEQAALANRRVVTASDVQLALDTLPWLARARPTR